MPEPTATQIDSFKQAVRSGDAAGVRDLIRTVPGLRERLDEPWFDFDSPAVLNAAGRGDRAVVDALVEGGADLNARSRWWAGGFGVLPHPDAEFAAYLISRGATVDIHAAAGMDMLERLQELVEADPGQVNLRGGDGQTPLHFAASRRIVEYLLEHGAELDARDLDHGSTPAQYMVKDRPELCRLLLEHGAEPDLFMACVLGDVPLAERLLRADPTRLRERVGQGKLTSGASTGGHIYVYTLGYPARPLHLAAESGNPELLRLLLQYATPSDRLLLACHQADEAAARQVLEEQPDLVRRLHPDDMRMISDAAWSHRTDSVRVMLRLGWDVNARGIHASTPLDRAAIRGYADLVELLLAHGADLEVRNEFGGTPLRACLWGSVNFQDLDGNYPACVELLLAAGAEVPEQIAGSPEVAAILRRCGARP